MKRYDYGGCDECSFGQLEESPEGDWMDADEVQARDLKLAELAKALPHGINCTHWQCKRCDRSSMSEWHKESHDDWPGYHVFEDCGCNCPLGEFLAMLEATNG